MVERRQFSSGMKGKNLRYLGEQREQAAAQARAGFILLTHFSLPAFTQALDTLVTANLLLPQAFSTTTFSLGGEEVTSDLGLVIRPDADIASLDLAAFDVLVVCGGLRTPLRPHSELNRVLQDAARQGLDLAGLWSGAWFLGQAGLLSGYRCAIHPEHRAALAEIAKASQVTSESFVTDRDRLTAASPSGAFYLALEWVGKLRGRALVEGIEDILAFEASRYRRVNPTLNVKMTAPLREVVNLMDANLEEPLELDQLADYVGRSRRQVERLFKDQLNTTPQRHYLELRITEGRRLLQHSQLSILEVAIACGFVSASHFSKRYTAYFGYPPSREARLAS